MKPTKCEKCGKYYDSEKYTSCPLCSGEVRVMTQRGETNSVSYQPNVTQQNVWQNNETVTSHGHNNSHNHASMHDKKNGLKSLFNKKKADKRNTDVQLGSNVSTANEWPKSRMPHYDEPADSHTRPLNQTMGTPSQVYDPVISNQASEALYNPSAQHEHDVYQPEKQIEQENSHYNQMEEQNQASMTNSKQEETLFTKPVSNEKNYSAPINQEAPAAPISSLEHTQSVYESSMPQKTPLAQAVEQSKPITDSKTVAFYNLSNETDPVVGWLVCIKGEYLGESFKIVSGRNNIGRALTNDIALAQEKTVSRERHAAIIFEPNNRQFFIQPGESSGLTYLNEEMLMNFKELKNKDIIGLGAVKFIFVQLCDEDFTWDSYID